MKKFLLAFSIFSILNLYGSGKPESLQDQLFNAIDNANFAEVEKLIRAGVNVNATNSKGDPAIKEAYKIYHLTLQNPEKKADVLKIFKLLINSGVNPATVNSLVFIAIIGTDLTVIEYLLSLPFIKITTFHLSQAKNFYQSALEKNNLERAEKLKKIGKMLLDHLRVYGPKGGISKGGLSTLLIELRRKIASMQFEE